MHNDDGMNDGISSLHLFTHIGVTVLFAKHLDEVKFKPENVIKAMRKAL